MSEILQLILDDMIKVIGDQSLSPDARVLAQTTAQNILRWDAGTGTVKVSAKDRHTVNRPMSV